MASLPSEFAVFETPGGMVPSDHFKIVLYNIQPNEGDLMLAGEFQRGNMRDRSFAGVDINGHPFVPYTPGYAKQKGQTNVDLFGRKASKHMLNALTVQVPSDASSINIGIWDDGELATRAQVHNEGATIRTRSGKGKAKPRKSKMERLFGIEMEHRTSFRMPQREFLGATEQDTNDMGQIIVNSIAARMEGI